MKKIVITLALLITLISCGQDKKIETEKYIEDKIDTVEVIPLSEEEIIENRENVERSLSEMEQKILESEQAIEKDKEEMKKNK